ncbi:FAD-dependent oxidoreductase [Bordetella petrii]|nr:FAD-dependent oxidoreductase [Bordetella petrii]
MTTTRYPRLLGPAQLGRKTTKNRIWMTAHVTQLVKDHLFTQEHLDYYAERARGGVGIITMEATAVHPTTLPYPGKPFGFDPRIISEYKKIAAAVHQHGTLVLAQPWHRGRQTDSVTSRLPVLAPSSIPCSVYREMPKVMTREDIEEIIDGYRIVARYAIEGNLDGVEIAAAHHGYLLNQFLSPATNHRQDEYGGSLENRMRIVMRIIEAIRQELGSEPIVGIRLNSDDSMEGGLGPGDWADIARHLTASGRLDYVSCAHGTYLNRMLIYPSSPHEHGFEMPATRVVKARLNVPVVGVGRITTPDEAEGILRAGDCDFVGMTRALIADAFWARKAQIGQPETIRPCVGANWCMASIFAHAPLACVHNPSVGRERELSEAQLPPAQTVKNVAVVGSGPAGLRAALTASQRGHRVTLIERTAQLGGQVAQMGRARSARELTDIVTWMIAQLRDTPADIYLESEATPELLVEAGYDCVVVATGSRPLRHGWSPLQPAKWGGPALDGADADWIYSHEDVLGEREPLQAGQGRNAVVVDTMGARHAALVSEYLAQQGWAVSFLTQLGQPLANLSASRDWSKVYGMLRRAGVTFIPNAELRRVDDHGIVYEDIYTKEQTALGDLGALVLINGARAEDGLYHALRERYPALEAHLIGDAVAPRRISDAIYEAEALARKL